MNRCIHVHEILQEHLDNRSKPRQFQGHRSKVRSQDRIYHCEIGQWATSLFDVTYVKST